MDQSIIKGTGILFFFALLLGIPLSGHSQSVCRGTDFWLAIPYNTSGNNAIEIKIVSDAPTTGTLTSLAGMSVSFSVSPGSPYTYIVPSTYAISTNQVIENKAIHIQTASTVSAFSGTIGLGGGDAVNIYPTPALGTSFIITNYYNLNPSTILVVAPSNGTQVTFTTPCATIAGSPANTPFTVTLNQGQTYMVRANCDLTGARVTSTQPVQVFSHTRCSQVPTGQSYCDCIWTTTLPTQYWNTEYVTGSLGGRNNTDRFRVVAQNNATQVQVNGTTVATLNAGQMYETTRSGGNVISASGNISVTQFAQSNGTSGGAGDPAMIQLLPSKMFGKQYRFATLLHGNITSHYLTIVTKTVATASVRLNGAALTGWTSIAGSPWSYRNGLISANEYTLTGDSNLHAVVHGWGSVNSYATSVGGANPVVILPIHQMDLKGQHIPTKGNLLAGRVEADNFLGTWELECSQDAQSADRVLNIPPFLAQGQFQVLDDAVQSPSNWFYRIRHRDLNGLVTVGDWVAVQAEQDAFQLSASPNPFKDELNIHFTLDQAGEAKLALFDPLGRLVAEQSIDGQVGDNQFHWNHLAPSAGSGVYLLKLTANGFSSHQTLIHP